MKRKFTKILTLILIIATVCVFVVSCKPKPVEGEKNITCELIVNSDTAIMTIKREGKDNVVYQCEVSSESKNVEDVLNDLTNATDFEYSVKKFGDDAFIQSMMDILAVQKNNEYFAFYMDGEYASYGITGTNLEENIKYEFILSTW